MLGKVDLKGKERNGWRRRWDNKYTYYFSEEVKGKTTMCRQEGGGDGFLGRRKDSPHVDIC